MRQRLPRAAVLLVVALAACNQRANDRDKISKPVDTVASAKPSAAPLVVAVAEPWCENGNDLVPAGADAGPLDDDAGLDASFGYGGLGLSGTGGWGDGIGLGTIGGFGTLGGVDSARAVKMKGATMQVEGLPRPAVEKTVCASFREFTPCIDAATSLEKDLDGTIGVTWTIDADGHTTAKVVGGTLEDEKLRACFTEAAGKVVFDAPKSKSATVTYAFDAHRAHKTKKVKMVETGATVSGRLPPEVIKRIVRANFPRFRFCYETELKKDPALKGTVVTRIVIGASGAVEKAAAEGGTMGNETVQACVTKVFGSLSFPEPEGGKVMVTYPISFDNAP
jgi:hypothetical protein